LRWLVDENMPRQVAAWLTAEGGDVLDVAASEHRGATDQALWALGGEEARIVVTRDLGFLWPAMAPHPAGVVIVRAPQEWQAADISELVRTALGELGTDSLLGNLTILEPSRTRQRPLAQVPEH
jgi:predicted nuclease of predicted toxin-antitoxin system